MFSRCYRRGGRRTGGESAPCGPAPGLHPVGAQGEGWGLLSVPPQYRPQVLHTLLITGREWLEWVSYCDAFPFSAQVLCVHIPRDETITQIEQYGEALRSFLVDVDSTVSDIKLIVESSHDHGPAPSYP